MTVIIGLNAAHPDSSACLLLDGKLVGAVAEERLGARLKHTDEFPFLSIKWLLDTNGLRLSDVDYISIARNPSANRIQKILYILKNLNIAGSVLKKYFLRNQFSSNNITKIIDYIGNDEQKIKYKIVFVEHHLAHIASSYYTSQFDTQTLGFSFDGAGDFASVMVAKCEGNDIIPIKKTYSPSSFGHFYSGICQFIGFNEYGEEYKVMGLAPYGENQFESEMSKILTVSDKNIIDLNLKYISPSQQEKAEYVDAEGVLRRHSLFTKNLSSLLRCEPRLRSEGISQHHKDIAKSAQIHFENITVNVINKYQKETGTKFLVQGGGCSLNGVTNAKILRETSFQKSFIHPAASDDGLAVGAAFYCWHNFLKRKDRFVLRNPYLGPEYSRNNILNAISNAKFRFFELENDDILAAFAAEKIFDGKVIGWFQGRSEWGPRALGNRSILANPLVRNMKDIINLKIKKRESFRPFAPSVLKEDVQEYFEQDVDSPFMMHVVKFKKEYLAKFPAVIHVDGTGRIQTVTMEMNSLYYNLILNFKKLSGHGIVLNTSFNENEPLVDTPEQALSCFARTNLDLLIMNRFVVYK